MKIGRFILAGILAGAAIGLFIAPDRSRNRTSLFQRRNSMSGKLDKRLQKFDNAIHKQVKKARKEISNLMEQ